MMYFYRIRWWVFSQDSFDIVEYGFVIRIEICWADINLLRDEYFNTETFTVPIEQSKSYYHGLYMV